MFWRTTAQRLLVDRGDKKVVNKLYALVQNEKTDGLGLNPGAVHALWTMHGLGVLNGDDKQSLDVVIKALRHPAAGVRRAAIEVLPATAQTSDELIASGVFADKDLRVVLAAILKTCDLPQSEKLGQILFDIAAKEGGSAEDKWIQKALYIAATVQHPGFEKAFKAAGMPEEITLGEVKLVNRIMMGQVLNVLSLQQHTGYSPNRLPDLTGREIYFTAQVQFGNEKPNGLIVAQGNLTNGYSVYVDNSKRLCFEVNQSPHTYLVQSKDTVADKFTVVAKLKKGGIMELYKDDKKVAEGKAGGLFKIPLRDAGSRLGNDYWKAV